MFDEQISTENRCSEAPGYLKRNNPISKTLEGQEVLLRKEFTSCRSRVSCKVREIAMLKSMVVKGNYWNE